MLIRVRYFLPFGLRRNPVWRDSSKVAGVAVPARRQELGLRVVGPDVGGLAVREAEFNHIVRTLSFRRISKGRSAGTCSLWLLMQDYM